MAFFRDISLRRGGADLVQFMRQEGNHRPFLFVAACIPPALIILAFYYDAMNKATPPPPEVIYFESWPATRTVEESRAAILENQKFKDEQRRREKEAYKAFGRAVGMDVDAIEREDAAQEAAAAKAREEQQAKWQAEARSKGKAQ